MHAWKIALASAHKPFSIGLRPLGVEPWIIVDDDLELTLGEKDRISDLHAMKVYVARPDSALAQQEAFQSLAAYLTKSYPADYRFDGYELSTASGRRVARCDGTDDVLRQLAMLVPEDLILMQRFEDGWRLTAGSLCFPSSWSLHEKFDRPLPSIHAPVPQFGPDTRNARVIHTIFDNLKTDCPAIRANWSLQHGEDLYHPYPEHLKHPDRMQSDDFEDLHLRTERQTLTRLRETQAVLFTIRIECKSINDLLARSETHEGMKVLLRQLKGLSEDQVRYKGLSIAKDRLINWLEGRLSQSSSA